MIESSTSARPMPVPRWSGLDDVPGVGDVGGPAGRVRLQVVGAGQHAVDGGGDDRRDRAHPRLVELGARERRRVGEALAGRRRCGRTGRTARRPGPGRIGAISWRPHGHQPRRSIGQTSTTSSPGHHVEPLVVGDGRVDVGRDQRTRSPTLGERPAVGGANVVCSSEQNHTSRRRRSVGLPWSMPSALSPASTTAQPPWRFTEITVVEQRAAPARTGRRWRRRCVSISSVGAGLDLGAPRVDVVGAGAAAGHDLAADVRVRRLQQRHRRGRPASAFVAGSTVIRWPS